MLSRCCSFVGSEVRRNLMTTTLDTPTVQAPREGGQAHAPELQADRQGEAGENDQAEPQVHRAAQEEFEPRAL